MFHADLGVIYKAQKFAFNHSYEEGKKVEMILDTLFKKYGRLVDYIYEN